MQHRCPILKLDLPGQIAMGSYPDLVGVAIIKAPVRIWNGVFANLFPDADKRALDRAIAVGPEVHLGGVEMGINPSGSAGEQWGFAHHHPLRKTAGRLERASLWVSLPQQFGELAAWVVKAHERDDRVCVFEPLHIARLKGKGHMTRPDWDTDLVTRKPLRSNRVLFINTPPSVGDDQGID